MDTESLKQSISAYQLQLSQVDAAIASAEDESSRNELCSLRDNIIELISLSQDSLGQNAPSIQNHKKNDDLDDEYALFMAEMEKEGATAKNESTSDDEIAEKLKSLEGMKCRAPHTHQWGDVCYHNALVCSVIPSDSHKSMDEIEVKVLFINPTHQEMLPCPYYLDTECKFDEEQCRYSHGETVLFSSLQDYVEPKFETLSIGSKVLAKQGDKLWYRATVKRVYTEKCLVKFDSNSKDLELEFHDLLPLESSKEDDANSFTDTDDEECSREDVINMSLLNTPTNEALGNWEIHTKGVGSKIMRKMGYIVGTGLGKLADGRIEPVTAVVLPAGKSLDHCMDLRERAGGDKDLFSVERKLKQLQRQQEKRNQKAYEREKKKVDMFNFLNGTISHPCEGGSLSQSKHNHRQEIAKETSRNLNVAGLKVEEDIKKAERDMFKIRESLKRQKAGSQVHKTLMQRLSGKQNELEGLRDKATNISSEQSFRCDKKKMTVF